MVMQLPVLHFEALVLFERDCSSVRATFRNARGKSVTTNFTRAALAPPIGPPGLAVKSRLNRKCNEKILLFHELINSDLCHSAQTFHQSLVATPLHGRGNAHGLPVLGDGPAGDIDALVSETVDKLIVGKDASGGF